MSTLQERLRAARERANLTSRALDRAAGLSVGVTSRLEAGKRMHVGAETLDKIASALGVSSAWLLRGEQEAEPRGEDDTGAMLANEQTREEAITLASEAGLMAEAILAAASMPLPLDGRHGASWWLGQMIAFQLKLIRKEQPRQDELSEFESSLDAVRAFLSECEIIARDVREQRAEMLENLRKGHAPSGSLLHSLTQTTAWMAQAREMIASIEGFLSPEGVGGEDHDDQGETAN